MKQFLLVVGAGLMAHAGVSQTQSVTSSLYFQFLDSAVVAGPAQAVYRVRRTEVPGQSRLDSVFFVASGRLFKTRSITWQPGGDTLTSTTHWRENGARAVVSQEHGDHQPREQFNYNPAGQLVRKAVWVQNKETQAECYTASGAPEPCAAYTYQEQMPEFPGGAPALFATIAKNMRYPRPALKKRQQGKVIVQFVVAETGEVRCLQVKEGVSAELDAEALRVLGALPRFQPGRQNGETVPVYYTVPVTFAIK